MTSRRQVQPTRTGNEPMDDGAEEAMCAADITLHSRPDTGRVTDFLAFITLPLL